MKIFEDAGIPTYAFPETGAKALAAMTRYAVISGRPKDAPAKLDNLNATGASAILADERKAGRTFMTQEKAFALLSCYGIAAPEAKEVVDLAAAKKAASDIGYPVVLKVESESVVHKSDEGGVALNLTDEVSLGSAFDKMAGQFAKHKPKYLVEQYLAGGREVILGAKKEAGLGHVIVFGLGGIFVEVLGDAAFGLAPLSRDRANQMITSIKSYPVLEGTRGQAPVDFDRLTDTLCRLGRLVTDNPEILELDLNPVFAFEEGKSPVAVDVRIKIK